MEKGANSIRVPLEHWFSRSCMLDFTPRPRENSLLNNTTWYICIATISFVIRGKGAGKRMLIHLRWKLEQASETVWKQKSGVSSILGSNYLKPETLTVLCWRANIDTGVSFVFINMLGKGRLFSSQIVSCWFKFYSFCLIIPVVLKGTLPLHLSSYSWN